MAALIAKICERGGDFLSACWRAGRGTLAMAALNNATCDCRALTPAH